MNSSTYLALVQNASLLLALALIFDLVEARHVPAVRQRLSQAALGLLLGGIGVAVMLSPWTFAPGIVFDTRSVLLSISGLFFGPLPTLIAMLITAAFRVSQGGAALTGVLVIFATGAMGIAWRSLRRRPLERLSLVELYLFGVAVHGVMLALMLTLSNAQAVLQAISLPVLLIYPLATALLGGLMVFRLRRERLTLALAESEERLRLANAAAHIGFFDRDLLTGKVHFSPEWKKQIGCADDELSDDNAEWENRLHPEDRAAALARVEECIRTRTPEYESEFRLRHKDGTYRTILSRGRLQFDEQGRAVRLLGCHLDVTLQRDYEQALLNSERRFRSLAESSQDYIMLYDRGARHVYMNPAGLRVTGRPAQEVIGKSHREAGYDPELSEMWEQDIRAVFATGVPHQNLFEWESAAGRIYLDWRLSPIWGADGSVELVLGISRDVTAIKQAEEAARKSEQRYRMLTENIQDVVWVLDADTLRFTYVSPSVQRLRGYTPEEIMAEPMDAALTPEGSAHVRRILSGRKTSFLNGAALPDQFFREELEQPCKDGSTVWTEVITRYSLNPDTGRVEVLGVTRDISARQRANEQMQAQQAELQRLLGEAGRSRQALLSLAEDQKRAEDQVRQLNASLEQRVSDRTALLEAANRELESFAYSISHDLRAPLRALDGYSAILQEDYNAHLDEEGRGYLQRIRDASQRMEQLINDLLSLAQVTRSEFERRSLDLSAMAGEVVAELLAQEPPGRRVETVIAPGMRAEADPRLLRIVMVNLISNALKFSAQTEGARIEVSQAEQDGQRVYCVRDNGAGFDMAYADKLFAPFQRLHGMREYPGTGIGLVTVQRIIARHGGRIWPEAAPDRGAAFYFTLGR